MKLLTALVLSLVALNAHGGTAWSVSIGGPYGGIGVNGYNGRVANVGVAIQAPYYAQPYYGPQMYQPPMYYAPMPRPGVVSGYVCSQYQPCVLVPPPPVVRAPPQTWQGRY